MKYKSNMKENNNWMIKVILFNLKDKTFLEEQMFEKGNKIQDQLDIL